MRITTLMALAVLASATALPAQTSIVRPEIRPFAGASIPTGNQRDFFKDAPMVGIQGAFELKPNLHVLGSFGYVPGQNLYQLGSDNARIYQYDLGLELGLVRSLGGNWQFKPFIGVGGGARSYTYQSTVLQNKTCASGYGAVGTEFQISTIALRLEARDNVFCFKSPIAGQDSKTRNDIGLMFGLAYHLR